MFADVHSNDNGSGIFGGVEFDGMTEIRRSMVILRDFNPATGQLERTCSGTLIGKNIVLTAAHCAPAPYLSANVLTKLKDGIIWFDQKGGEGICDGDSGGLLFVEKNRSLTFVGVTSFSMNAEGKCTGAGFVNIRPHLSWIQKTMAALQDKYR